MGTAERKHQRIHDTVTAPFMGEGDWRRQTHLTNRFRRYPFVHPRQFVPDENRIGQHTMLATGEHNAAPADNLRKRQNTGSTVFGRPFMQQVKPGRQSRLQPLPGGPHPQKTRSNRFDLTERDNVGGHFSFQAMTIVDCIHPVLNVGNVNCAMMVKPRYCRANKLRAFIVYS